MIAILLALALSGNYANDQWTWYYVGNGPPAVGACLQNLGYGGDPQWAGARILAPRQEIKWCQKWDAVLDPKDTVPSPSYTATGD